MPALSSLDIEFRYTGDADSPSNAYLSRGGSILSTIIPDTINNIFDDVTGDESQTGTVEYRGIAIYINTFNTQAARDALKPRIWISGYSSDAPDSIAIAASTFGLNANQMGSLSSEYGPMVEENLQWVWEGESKTIYFGTDNAPTTIQPSQEGTLLSEHWVGLWLMRSVPPDSGAYSNRVCTITFRCESSASPYHVIIERTFEIEFSGNPVC